MAYNKRQKLQDNIAAIRTVFQLEKEGRAATDAEREVLKRYSGFGGLKFVLKPTGSDADKQYWNQSELTYFDQTKELFDIIREGASDEKEAKELTDSIKRSVNTAFYTPAPVIGAIAKVMKDAGVEVRSMLDPSAGIGKFGDAFKGEYSDLRVSAFEKDLLTGRILKALNPQDNVTIDGFETIKPELKGTFDVATSNIPFGDIKVMDDEYRKSGNDAKRYAVSTIHNYFFLKALDQVREGGFVAFITSRGFMDSPSNNPIREELAKNARLVGAFRLPDGMFRDEAGTDVGSDLVVLQKYTGYDMSLDPDTQAFCDVNTGFKAMSGEDWTDISMNCHWWKSMMAPDSEAIVATKMEKGTDPYGKPTLVCTHDGGMEGIAQLLTEYFKVLIQVTLEILCKQLGYPLHSAVMGAYQCRLAVGVGAFLHLRGHDSLRVRGHHRLPPVAVHRDVRPVLTTHSLEALVHVAECLCIRIERHIVARVFLENDQVRADIRSCFVAEHAVGQTESSHKTGIPGQFLADGIVRR